jgi:uncharacterized protein (DUF362 family)/Pyruvate/2-oxoacid:ferredoxin oxidoreductase delta subunit
VQLSTDVALARCSSYSAGNLNEGLRQVLRALGGLESMIHPGQSVLIKPNLLTDRPPEAAVTTHPELVRALIRLVRDLGATPFVADSPSNANKLSRVWERTGFTAMCREESAELLSLEKAGSVPVNVAGTVLHVARPVMDADVIINVPKVKTHMLTVLTCAMKNLYGTLPGYQKTQLHGDFVTPAEFGRLIMELARVLKPVLHVADGVVGMQGEGPSAGEPASLGFLAASREAPALDYVVCGILGINPRAVPYLRPLLPALTGEGGGNPVRSLGTPAAELRPASFRVPSTLAARMLPGPLVRLLWRMVWIRPVIANTCVRCSRCVESCPVSALARQPAGAPALTPRLCIGCCCCHEVCPVGAVSMTQSPLLSLIRGRRTP